MGVLFYFAILLFYSICLGPEQTTLEKSSPEFQELSKLIKHNIFKATSIIIREQGKIIRFALKKAARMVHRVPLEYNIIPSVREELIFLKSI